MNLNFAAALATLGADAAMRIANEARPAAEYMLNDLLPEENRPTYHVDSGSMTVRATMAGLVAMDSDYPPTGHIEVSTFLENTAKIANHTKLPEATLRTLQQALATMQANGALDTTQTVVNEALNFLQLVVLQPQLDVSEWLRGQALALGAINWQFGKKGLVVDYGVPAGNINPLRLLAGGAGVGAYGTANSAFWTDIQFIRRTLRRGGLRTIIMHPDLADAARYNPANQMVVTNETDSTMTFRRIIPGTRDFTPSAEDTVTVTLYGLEGEILNPANPSSTLIIPFWPRNRMVGIGNAQRRGYRVGLGSQDNPGTLQNVLGYTHIAPTVEGGGRPGRWSDLFTPQMEPWSLHGRAASNQLPVIEDPTLIAIAQSEI